MSFDEIIELSIFVTNIENFFRQIPIIPHLRENTACGCWRKTKMYSLRLNASISSWEENVTNYLFFESLHVPFFLWSYTVCFQKKLSTSSFIFDGKFTFQLIMMMTQWPHGIYNFKHLKYVERRYFWHIKKTFQINHHIKDTVIEFQALIIQLYNEYAVFWDTEPYETWNMFRIKQS